jgi:hypothetical protein
MFFKTQTFHNYPCIYPEKKDDNKKPDVFSYIINEYKAAVFLALGSETISKNKTQFAGP